MDDAEFFAHATSIVNDVEVELRRVTQAERGRWRALEIGCGAGRLMRPLSRHFMEIHGVDPSPARVAQARENLADIPNARIHAAEDGGLPALDGEGFDFLYSLEAGFDAWPWIQRVLRTGGFARLRFHGLEKTRTDLLEFAAGRDLQVLAMEGASTRSLWTTWLKRAPGWGASLQPPATSAMIRRITNAFSNEPVAPCRGRFAAIAIRAENLPADAGLQHLRVTVGSSLGTVTRIGGSEGAGIRIVHADLPELEATGLLPVQLFWLDRPISEPATLRVIPPGPSVPRVLGVYRRPGTRSVTITMEELARPQDVEVSIAGHPVSDLEHTCIDPRPQRYEITFRLPEQVGPGLHHVKARAGRRAFAPLSIEVGA